MGLTSVFGMGTGVSPSLKAPSLLGCKRITSNDHTSLVKHASVSKRHKHYEIYTTGLISMARLNTLPCVHLPPINHVLADIVRPNGRPGNLPGVSYRNVILEWASRLDAFSAYHQPNLATQRCPRTGQLVHQRLVPSGPLVLGRTLLTFPRLRQIGSNLSCAVISFYY